MVIYYGNNIDGKTMKMVKLKKKSIPPLNRNEIMEC